MAATLQKRHFWEDWKHVTIFNKGFMEKNNQNNKRRLFLKNSLKAFGGSVLLGTYLSSCSGSFYNELTIDEALCIGCGDCDDVCNYAAIITNGVSNYSIKVNDCSICSWCVSVCEDDAIKMPEKSYEINVSNCTACNECIPSCNYNALKIVSNTYTIKSGCVGCGDCVPVCKNEGEAIAYEKENYSVSTGRCHGCVSRCSGACKYNAITKVNGRAYINKDKCTKCGDCLKACPHSAINKAYVKIDQDNCTKCGKCFDVCTYNQITKSGKSDIDESHIERLSCTNCGDCIDTCPEDAIYIKSTGDFNPEINNDKCTACGNCFDICTEGKAISRTIATVSINQNNCMKCDKCFDVCNYEAVLIG